MPEGIVVGFGSPGAYLGFTLLDRAFPDAATDWERDAIVANVTIEAEDFHGEFRAFTWSHEIVQLRKVLQHLDQHVGEAAEQVFRLLDADLWLTFKLGKRGDIQLDVESRRGAVPHEARLYYTIFADQSYLAQWAQAVDDALATYPPQLDWAAALMAEHPRP